MQKNLAPTAPKAEEDPSDVLSNSSNNSGHNSPSGQNALNSEELDTLCDGSKKIRKKRNAYQKIDDDIRLRLLEAVKHGETLKSAAKKFKINYSSAKSILHTYRKEGRILKKSAQERNIKRNPSGTGEGGDGDGDGTPQPMSDNEEADENREIQTTVKGQGGQTEIVKGSQERVKSEGLTTGQELVDNLVNLLKRNGSNGRATENAKPQVQTPKAVNKESTRAGTMEEEPKGQAGIGNSVLSDLMGGSAQNPANLMNLTQMLQGNSIEKFKVLDNLFGNMAGSPFPIVTKAIKAYTDSSGSKTETAEKDADSPSEEANTEQGQVKKSEEIFRPHPLRFNTAQLLQEKIETQLNNNSEDMDWDVTIENAAIDTFKSFMDAQLLLCDALKKASYLNSLMQAQKAKTETNLVQNQL